MVVQHVFGKSRRGARLQLDTVRAALLGFLIELQWLNMDVQVKNLTLAETYYGPQIY
jgi:hypothetical protein